MRRPLEPQLIEFDASELEIAPTVHFARKGIAIEVIGVRQRIHIHLTYYQAQTLRERLNKVLGDQNDTGSTTA